MNTGTDPKLKVDETTIIVEPETTHEEKKYLHDKRYEKPFENDGAYADDTE